MWPDEPIQVGYITFRGVRKLKHSCHAQEFLLPWSCTFTPSPRKTAMEESIKQTLVLGLDAREQGVSWGLITPLRMPSLLPHDLCHGQSSSRWPPAIQIIFDFVKTPHRFSVKIKISSQPLVILLSPCSTETCTRLSLALWNWSIRSFLSFLAPCTMWQ